MKKQNSKKEPQYIFIGSIDLFASRLVENIGEIASNVGWSPVKEVLLASKIMLKQESIITQQVVHQDGISTVFIIQVGNQNGAPIEAIEYAGEEIVEKLTETGPDSVPTRFVVVCPIISENVVKMSQKRKIPLSFLMVNNDLCTYWESI
ncbi:MAG: hypothetical protein CVU12_01390 [Bacteroidetes bacterium HGW-Bacteroidetes-7]|jgi:hypothetical protein|nr:MAG: hypothetical protein CVU12_01390 [Bacteroidetes bacterium HGW-Bacteroidetes-7]